MRRTIVLLTVALLALALAALGAATNSGDAGASPAAQENTPTATTTSSTPVPTPTNTALPGTPTPTPTWTVVPAGDADGDGVQDPVDNCQFVVNPGQANYDRNFVELDALGVPYDDLTRVSSDRRDIGPEAFGDDCDSDDDQDAISDAREMTGADCGGSTTDPRNPDTDLDGFIDGWECFRGFDGGSSGDHPTLLAHCGTYADEDGDGLLEAHEHCFYGTNDSNNDTDDDDCQDGQEVASVNGDSIVNSLDLQQVAQRYGPQPPFVWHWDYNHDARVNSLDLSFIARRFGQCRDRYE